MKVRNGIMIRDSQTVSAICPGIATYSLVTKRPTSGSAKMMPITTRTPVISSSALVALTPRRIADGLPSVVRRRVKVGTNAALITPSANRSRSRFGTRKAIRYASMSLLAPNKPASTCSRTTPKSRLASVAALPEAAERASVRAEEDSGSKLAADGFVDGTTVGILAGQLRHHGLHDLADVLGGGGPGFGDGEGDGGIDLFARRRRRQIFVEDGDLGGLLLDQIGASCLGELVDGIPALLHQRPHDLKRLVVIEIASFFDALVHDRGLEHPQSGEAARVLRFHRRRDVGGHGFDEGHDVNRLSHR